MLHLVLFCISEMALYTFLGVKQSLMYFCVANSTESIKLSKIICILITFLKIYPHNWIIFL